MNHRFRFLALGALLVLASNETARADVIHLRTGGRLEGVLTRETASGITIDVGMGEITVPQATVLRIERKESALSEYRNRLGAIVPGDVMAHANLARFAADHALRHESRLMWGRVLSFDPRNVEAHLALGHVLVDGQYVDEAEAYRSRGFVYFEGRWMSAAEQASILREREQRIAYERQVDEARRLARDAEDRARRAEAEAERARAAANVWSPVWGYGGTYVGSPYWGGGYGARNPGYYPGYPGCVGAACGNRPHVSPHGGRPGPLAPPLPQAPPVRPSSIR